MHAVTTIEQIHENIAELERGRSAGGRDAEEYRALVRRGTCFLPYPSTPGQLSFAPSRFIGYVGNKLTTHADNVGRDGRQTNVAINEILGLRPYSNDALERRYRAFCSELSIVPLRTGTYGVARKYWVTPDVIAILESGAEGEILANHELSETEKQQLVKARIGQGLFRERLLSMWGQCCITGCDHVSILRASHIKPWRDSTNEERLDAFNGLLLSPTFDALFDKGLISFTDSGEMLIAETLSEQSRGALGCDNRQKVALRAEHVQYISWHRSNIFVDAAA